jgi:hypothetical protein
MVAATSTRCTKICRYGIPSTVTTRSAISSASSRRHRSEPSGAKGAREITCPRSDAPGRALAPELLARNSRHEMVLGQQPDHVKTPCPTDL